MARAPRPGYRPRVIQTTDMTVHSMTFLTPDNNEGPWLVTVDLELGADVPRCVGLHVRTYQKDLPSYQQDEAVTMPGKPVRELTAVDLRGASIPKLVQRAIEVARSEAFWDLSDGVIDEATASERRTALLGRARRYDESHFRAVAETYSEALRSGDAPTKAVATRYGLKQSTAANQVARCREMGLLGPTVPGRAGGGASK